MGLQLAPHTISGRNVCPNASKGCAAACLFTAGMGVYQRIKNARIKKTQFFFEDHDTFMANLFAEIEYYVRRAKKKGLKLALRLNTISDIAWEKKLFRDKNLFEHFPHVQFYDYTKNPARAIAFSKGELPKNYHLTFSRSESNGATAQLIANLGVNVAVVFKKLPAEFYGKKVVSGDKSDARWKDKKGVIVGLVAKGKARKDQSGFVVL